MRMYDATRLAAGAPLARVVVEVPGSPALAETEWFEPTVTTENGSLKIEGKDGTTLVRAPGTWSSVEVRR